MLSISRISLLLLLILSLDVNTLTAQHLPSGAEAAGLGFANVAMKGKMATWGNAAGLSEIHNQQLLAGYENRYGMAEGLHSLQAGFIQSFQQSVAAISLYRLGDELYSLHKLSLSLGHKVGQFSGGLRLSQHQLSMEGADTRYALSIDAGAIAKLSSQLDAGIQISNISQAKVSKQTGERIPTSLAVGFNYHPDQNLRVLGELFYELERAPVVKVGLEYMPLKYVAFRSGINAGEQTLLFLGLGLRHRIIHIDYALETHPLLGMSQHIGLAYQLQQNAKK